MDDLESSWETRARIKPIECGKRMCPLERNTGALSRHVGM